MHFPFTLTQVLWTFTFAAQMTLLVVLMGRDRIRRFPCFTLSIALFAVRLLVEVLLTGRMAMVPYRTTMLLLADLMAIAGVLVAVELARRGFSGATVKQRAVGAFAVLAIAVATTGFWGKWPSLQGVDWHNLFTYWALMQLFAQKADLFMGVLVIGVGVLVVAFGGRFGAGWRSHVRKIVLGQSLVALSSLLIQVIATRFQPHTQAEYEQMMKLWELILKGHEVLYVAVLVWWIVSLWKDEPAVPVVGTIEGAIAAEATAGPGDEPPLA